MPAVAGGIKKKMRGLYHPSTRTGRCAAAPRAYHGRYELQAIQAAIREAGFDGWLFYDHHHRDPIAGRILGMDEKAHVTRRWYYFVPAAGEPRKLVHRIEQARLDALPGAKALYSSWQELAAGLEAMLAARAPLAMQYSPNNAIMYVSMVDAGTVEFLRRLGKQIVSSADLVSQFEAVLSEEQVASHSVAQRAIDAILAEGWREIGRRLRPGAGKGVVTASSTTCNGSARPVQLRSKRIHSLLGWFLAGDKFVK